MMWKFLILILVFVYFYSVVPSSIDIDVESYGYDVSYPMLQEEASTNYPWLPHNMDPKHNPTPNEYKDMPLQILGDRQSFYSQYMEGCRKYWSEHHDRDHNTTNICDAFDKQRIQHIRDQVHSMRNFTDLGYQKLKAPQELFDLILKFWNDNKDEGEQDEEWIPGNSFVNYWESMPTMVNVQHEHMKGGGFELMKTVWKGSVDIISDWTGEKLVPSSIYGIRVYKEGAILAPHVDRLPLISSAIINVAQDVEEPWPLEVVGHDNIARNITMEPGDMVLYESHSVVHGRPFPLQGKYYANLFIHFEPDPTLLNIGELPKYILEESIEANKYMNGEYDGEIPSPQAMVLLAQQDKDQYNSHIAAAEKDLIGLHDIASYDINLLFSKDNNGWQPIHEAARSGSLEVVQFLVDHGADRNAKTYNGLSVLDIVQEYWGSAHELYEYLFDSRTHKMDVEL